MSILDIKMDKEIIKIIDNAQTARANHKKNLILLKSVYNSADFERFLQCFLRILEQVVPDNFENPHVKYALEFLGKFVGHINTVENIEDDPETELSQPTHLFLKAVLQRIIKYHDVSCENCRYNTCRFLSLVLENAGENVDNHSIDLMQNAMLENLQDSKHVIRMQAIAALTRLQDPRNPECPVIRNIMDCLIDSHYLIRREAVNRLAPNKLTIPKINERTRDVDANVRAAALKRLGDIGIKYLKIVQRQFVLKSGFAEKNSHAKKVFVEYLLPKWLTCLDGSYLAFLNAIKLDADEADILYTEELCTQLMNLFFKTEPINKLIEALPLETTKLVPETSMSSELALYWNIVVKYLRQDKDLEEFLDRIIPELTIFCNFIESLIRNRFSKTMEEWDYIDFQYLLYNLFDMAEHGDISEEVGRRTLDKLIKTVLRKHRFQPRLLNKIVEVGSRISSKVNLFVDEICLIISDIWQPLTEQLQPNEKDNTDKEFRIAELIVKLNILEGDQEDAVIEQDFEKAQKLKIEIAEHQRKLNQLKSECAPVEQVRVVTEDPETICWCLDLLASLLAHGNINNLTLSLIALRDTFLMPLMKSQNVEIAWRTFKCVTLCCIFDRTFAEQQIKTICIPIASYRIIPNFNKTILTDSVAVVTDLIRLHGAEFFNTENDFNSSNRPNGKIKTANKKRLYSEDVDEADSIDPKLTVDFIISVLLDMLDDENNDIAETAATAMAKLMLNEFAINSMVVARLILKWYNPLTQEHLQQMLGVIINSYTETVSNSKEIIAKSISPILISIAEAPRTSPLAEIDVDNVIKFLAVITDSGDVRGLLHVHTGLARILIQEISTRPAETVTVYFAKMLSLLNITPDDSPAVKELIANAKLILDKNLLEKKSKRHVVKFVAKCNGQQVNSTGGDSTTNVSGSTTNVSGNVTNTRIAVQARPLSPVIEEVITRKTRKRRKINPSDNVHRTDGSTDAVAKKPSKTSTRSTSAGPVRRSSRGEQHTSNFKMCLRKKKIVQK